MTSDLRPRCAASARDQGLQPVGTAPHPAGFLLVEWPLPWPRDAGLVDELVPLRIALERTGTRLQLLAPVEADDSLRRVTLHRRDGDWFAGFDRVERLVPPGEVVATALALLGGAGGAPGTTASGRGAAPTPDVLVCTHGRRDRCCGARGTSLALEAQDLPSARLGRTSHLGGHRFAPTAVLLPEGTAWGFLDAPSLRAIVARDRPVDEVIWHYRGSAGLPGAGLQALEAQAFAEVGWGWLDLARRGSVAPDGTVALEARDAAGEVMAWRAVARVGRTVEIAACGDPDGAPAVEHEVALSEVTRLR